jgi:hypothetical protein
VDVEQARLDGAADDLGECGGRLHQ